MLKKEFVITNSIKILAILILFFLSSCNNMNHPERGDSFVVTDMLEREVVIPQNVEKIVGLRAGALRLLVYMDAVPLIAGIEEPEKTDNKPYTKAYPELKNLPSIGPYMGGDAEMILNAKPDVIFISYTTKDDANSLQKRTGIPVVAIECSDLGTQSETLFASLRLIGKVINKEERADSLVKYINNSISELNNRTKNIENRLKPSVYVGGLSYSGSYGINSTHSNYAPFLFTNSYNVAANIDKRLSSHVKGTFVDIEQLLVWNPDYLFIDESGYAMVLEDFRTKTVLKNTLNAIENNNLFYLLPYNNYATNYEFVLLNSWFIGNVLYSQNFKDIIIKDKAEELLSFFYNKPINFEFIKSELSLQQFSVK